MRLQKLASATAFALFLAPTLLGSLGPSAAAAGPGPSLGWVTPTDGGRIEPNSTVVLSYAPANGTFGPVNGSVLLDGTPVGALHGFASSNDSTTVTAAIDATGFAFGDHTLDAFVSANNTTISAPRITVTLAPYDQPPAIVAWNVSYDLAQGAFVARGIVTDPDGPALRVTFQVANGSATSGDSNFTLVVPAADRAGKYPWSLTASDGIHSSNRTGFASIADRPPQVAVSSARHELGGRLIVEGTVSDPDSGVAQVVFTTPFGTASARPDPNGTFRVEVRGNLTPGRVNGTVVAVDDFGQAAGVVVFIDLEPTHMVLYDRVVQINDGASVDSEKISMPLAYGVNVTSSQSSFLAGSFVWIVQPSALGTPDQVAVVPIGTTVGASTRLGDAATVAWAFAGSGAARIHVEGNVL